jgi:golgi apparatus membrane protein TVP38
MLATVCIQPRVFLAVFIGSRIAKFSDKDQRGQMDTSEQTISLVTHLRLLTVLYCTATKFLDGTSIAVGILLGIGLGWSVMSPTAHTRH